MADTLVMQNPSATEKKTGKGLAAYVTGRLGTPYFYGAEMEELTENLMQRMHREYPEVVTEKYMKKAREMQFVGKICCDCSSLIGAYRGRYDNSGQLYAQAKKRLPIEELKDFAVGTVLWRPGHVAVFTGYENGVAYCIEARGLDYGCVKSAVKGRGFLYGLTFSDLSYT